MNLSKNGGVTKKDRCYNLLYPPLLSLNKILSLFDSKKNTNQNCRMNEDENKKKDKISVEYLEIRNKCVGEDRANMSFIVEQDDIVII